MREGDFHRIQLTIDGAAEIFKATNKEIYLSPGVPLALKALLESVFIPFALAALYLVWQTAQEGLRNLKAATPFAVSITCWGVCLFLAAVCDKTGINDTQPKIRNIEEMLEFTAAVYALTAVILYTMQLKQSNEEEQA